MHDRLCNEATQTKLLSEANLSLARAIEIVKSSEAAVQGAHALKNGVNLAVGLVESQPKKSLAQGKPLYRCGKQGHAALQCSCKEATCQNCGKKGHLARVYRGGKKPPK